MCADGALPCIALTPTFPSANGLAEKSLLAFFSPLCLRCHSVFSRVSPQVSHACTRFALFCLGLSPATTHTVITLCSHVCHRSPTSKAAATNDSSVQRSHTTESSTPTETGDVDRTTVVPIYPFEWLGDTKFSGYSTPVRLMRELCEATGFAVDVFRLNWLAPPQLWQAAIENEAIERGCAEMIEAGMNGVESGRVSVDSGGVGSRKAERGGMERCSTVCGVLFQREFVDAISLGGSSDDCSVLRNQFRILCCEPHPLRVLIANQLIHADQIP